MPANTACHDVVGIVADAADHADPGDYDAPAQAISSFRVGVDVIDGVFDSADLLRILVGNLDVESLFEGHDQFDGVERVGAQVVDKRRVRRDFALVHAQLLNNDLFYPFINRCHE